MHEPRAHDDRGASMVEYALLLIFAALVCLGAVKLLGERTASSLDRTGSSIADATP